MNCAQIAHFLKTVGMGCELAGIRIIYHRGQLIGGCQAVAAIGAAYGIYRLGKWGYVKLAAYLQAHGYTLADDTQT